MNSKDQNTKDVLLERYKHFSSQPIDLASSLADLILQVSINTNIRIIRFLPAKYLALPNIWVENQKLISIDDKWSSKLLSKIDLQSQPLKLHRMNNSSVPILDGGYILLSNDLGYLGVLIFKIIDIDGNELSENVLKYLELFASFITSTIHSNNKILRLEGKNKIVLDAEDRLAKILERQQRTIAIDLIEGIAHGVANPLAVILANQDILEEYTSSIENLLENEENSGLPLLSRELHSLFIDQRSAIERLDHLLADLRRYAQGAQSSLYRTMLNQAIEQGVNLSQLRADLRNRISLNLNPTSDVKATPFGISQALFHVLKFIAELTTKSTEIINISTMDSKDDDDAYTKVILQTKVEEITIDDENIDITVASHFIKGYGGSIDIISADNQLSVIIKLLPMVSNGNGM